LVVTQLDHGGIFPTGYVQPAPIWLSTKRPKPCPHWRL